MSEKINFDTTLGNFVATYPKTRKVFEEFGLDYCCGGNKDIEIAAKEKNIDLNELISSLKSAIEEASEKDETKVWKNESLTDIINHIESKHHTFMWKELPRVDKLLDKVVQVHGAKHGNFLVSLSNIFKELKKDLEKHLKDEEDLLFPYVKELEASINAGQPYKDKERFKDIVESLCTEHDEAGEALSQIRNLTSNFVTPKDACTSFKSLYESLLAIEDDLHEHVHLENTVLFPRIKELTKSQT